MRKLDFSIEEDIPVKTIGELQAEFYPIVTLKKKELKPAYRDDPKARQLNPQVLVFNPPGYGNPDSVTHTDVWVAVYYRSYYVRVQHGNSMFGPHKLELYYQVRRGLRVWLGTCTYKFDFFSKKRTRMALKKAIRFKAYYCSEKSAEEIVELYIPEADANL